MSTKPEHRHLYADGWHRRTAPWRAAWTADPTTRCEERICLGWGNRTRAEHPRTKTGELQPWTAGHKNPEHGGRSDCYPSIRGCNIAERNDRVNNERKPRRSVTW